MKHPSMTVQIESAEHRASDDAPPDQAMSRRHQMVSLRGWVIYNPDSGTPPRFALREDSGALIALSGVYSDEDGWLIGARVEVEGRYLSDSVLSVSKLIVRQP